MSKKKTDKEMIFGAFEAYKKIVKNYVSGKDEDGCYEYNECEETDGDCSKCDHWDWRDGECLMPYSYDEEENEDEEEEQYYRYPECECVDGECDQCDHWVNKDYCELDDIYENCEGHEICGCSDEDCYSCKGSKEHRQTEELSKFIMSVNTVLGRDMGLLVFDKSNKKDMEKLAAIFGEYAKRLS